MSYVGGNSRRVPPVEVLTVGAAAVFNFVNDDAFGTNTEDDFTLLGLFLTHHTIEQNPIFWQLLAHLKGEDELAAVLQVSVLELEEKKNIFPVGSCLEELKL